MISNLKQKKFLTSKLVAMVDTIGVAKGCA